MTHPFNIVYNDSNPGNIQRRSEQVPPTLQEEIKVIEIINRLEITDENEIDLLQKFVHHYENLNHHMSTTCGLWATDQPDKLQDPEGLLFQIEF